MTRIVLIRHGHVEGISPPRFRGRQDVPLTKRGIAEAEAVASCVARRWQPAAIYTSPLQRCTATAAAIAAATGRPQSMLAELADLDFGLLQWKTHGEAKASYPELFELWFSAPQLVRFPNGESLQDLAGRAANALREVMARSPSETVVMVGHDHINRALLLQVLDQPLSAFWRLSQAPCCINEFEVTGSLIRVHSINETGHLAGLRDQP